MVANDVSGIEINSSNKLLAWDSVHMIEIGLIVEELTCGKPIILRTIWRLFIMTSIIRN